MKRYIPQPKGYDLPDGRTRISIAISKELFGRICEQARKDDKTFSQEAELLLTTGLFDIQESDALEPAA